MKLVSFKIIKGLLDTAYFQGSLKCGSCGQVASEQLNANNLNSFSKNSSRTYARGRVTRAGKELTPDNEEHNFKKSSSPKPQSPSVNISQNTMQSFKELPQDFIMQKQQMKEQFRQLDKYEREQEKLQQKPWSTEDEAVVRYERKQQPKEHKGNQFSYDPLSVSPIASMHMVNKKQKKSKSEQNHQEVNNREQESTVRGQFRDQQQKLSENTPEQEVNSENIQDPANRYRKFGAYNQRQQRSQRKLAQYEKYNAFDENITLQEYKKMQETQEEEKREQFQEYVDDKQWDQNIEWSKDLERELDSLLNGQQIPQNRRRKITQTIKTNSQLAKCRNKQYLSEQIAVLKKMELQWENFIWRIALFRHPEILEYPMAYLQNNLDQLQEKYIMDLDWAAISTVNPMVLTVSNSELVERLTELQSMVGQSLGKKPKTNFIPTLAMSNVVLEDIDLLRRNILSVLFLIPQENLLRMINRHPTVMSLNYQDINRELEIVQEIFRGLDIIDYVTKYPQILSQDKARFRWKLSQFKSLLPDRDVKYIQQMFYQCKSLANMSVKTIELKIKYLQDCLEGCDLQQEQMKNFQPSTLGFMLKEKLLKFTRLKFLKEKYRHDLDLMTPYKWLMMDSKVFNKKFPDFLVYLKNNRPLEYFRQKQDFKEFRFTAEEFLEDEKDSIFQDPDSEVDLDDYLQNEQFDSQAEPEKLHKQQKESKFDESYQINKRLSQLQQAQ